MGFVSDYVFDYHPYLLLPFSLQIFLFLTTCTQVTMVQNNVTICVWLNDDDVNQCTSSRIPRENRFVHIFFAFFRAFFSSRTGGLGRTASNSSFHALWGETKASEAFEEGFTPP